MKGRVPEYVWAALASAAGMAAVLVCMAIWRGPGLLCGLFLLWAGGSVLIVRTTKQRRRWVEPAILLGIVALLGAALWPAVPVDLSWRRQVVTDVAFSPDSRLLLWRAGGVVHVQETATGREVRALTLEPRRRRSLWPFTVLATEPPPAMPFSIVVSPDGSRAAIARGDDPVAVYNLGSGLKERELTAEGRVTCLTLAPDGFTLIGAEEPAREEGHRRAGRLRFWDIRTGRPLRALPIPGPSDFINGLWPAPGGRLWLRSDEEARAMELPSGRTVRVMKAERPGLFLSPASVAMDARGANLATRELGKRKAGGGWGPDALVVRETATMRPIGRLPARAENDRAMALSPDGKTLAESGARAIHLRDVAGRGKDRVMTAPLLYEDLAFSPDGKWLAAATWSAPPLLRRLSSLTADR